MITPVNLEWFLLFQTKNTTVLKALKGSLRITGKLGMIQSNNGGEFNNDLLKDFLKHKRIEYVRGSPYHPKCQGAVEGLNKTVQNFLNLKKDMHDDEFELNDSIYDLCMHYNNWKHTNTKISLKEFSIVDGMRSKEKKNIKILRLPEKKQKVRTTRKEK